MKQQLKLSPLAHLRQAVEAAGPWGETLRPRLELSGDESLTVWRHSGLLEYSDGQLRIAAGEHIYTVEGRGLHIAAMSRDMLAVRGDIHHVGLEARP